MKQIDKILIVSTIYPYPIDNGKKVTFAGLFEYFVLRFGKRNVRYVVLDNKERKSTPGVFYVKKPAFYLQLFNVLFYSFLLRKKSLQESTLFARGIGKKISNIIVDFNPDLILYDTIRVAQYFEHKKPVVARHILYLDDLFSLRYAQMIKMLDVTSVVNLNPLGNFAKYLPSTASRVVANKQICRALLNFEQKMLEKRERAMVGSFDESLLVNSQEVRLLRDRTNSESIREIRPILNIASSVARSYSGNADFVFLGAMSVPHNAYSISRFMKKWLDPIIERVGNFRLLIVGKGVSEEIKALAGSYPKHIIIMGYVNNLDQIFAEACGMISPLLFGGGVKLKVLEALARGLPVLATSFGVEGIALENERGCILEDNFANYAKHIKQLSRLEINQDYSKQAMAFFQQHYARTRVVEMYDKIF